jgi:hypothetical protein
MNPLLWNRPYSRARAIGGGIIGAAFITGWTFGWGLTAVMFGGACALAAAFIAVRRRQRRATFSPDSFEGPLGDIHGPKR